MSSSPSASSGARHTYRQLLQEKSSEWFRCNLLHSRLERADNADKEFWRLGLYEVRSDSLAARHFKSNVEEWEQGLLNFDPESNLRIVTVYVNWMHRDWEAIDAVASLYQINPAFFLRFTDDLFGPFALRCGHAEIHNSDTHISLCVVEGNATQTRAGMQQLPFSGARLIRYSHHIDGRTEAGGHGIFVFRGRKTSPPWQSIDVRAFRAKEFRVYMARRGPYVSRTRKRYTLVEHCGETTLNLRVPS